MSGKNAIQNKKTAVIAGCGGISSLWLETLKDFDNVKITGLVDLDIKNAEAKAQEFGLDVLTGKDLGKMLDAVKPDIVFDCTVPQAHYNVVLTALDHGCNVLGEKPMAGSMKQARKMLRAAEKSGKTYAVIQNRRYNGNISAFRNVLKSGKAGDLSSLYADFFIGAHFGGFRENMEHVLLLDMAIHTFDQARYISGLDPLYVYAYEWNPPGSWFKHGASAICIFEMENGVVFNYRGSWCAEGMDTSWDCSWRALCTGGTVVWDGGENISGEIVEGDNGFIRRKKSFEIENPVESEYSGHAGVIHDFLESLENGKKPPTDCTDNIKSLAMVHAAVESIKKGRKVKIKY